MGQDYNEYATVDEKAFRIPDTITNSTASIAAYIQSNFITEKEKLLAIYTWVTANIRYDTDSMYYKKWGESAEEKMAAILRRRKGVCENYAALFTDIAVQCGIQTIVVNGYTRQSGFVNWAGHSWCAVCTNKEWFLCDPTWDEGVHPGTKYFLVQPDQFIESHMPYDPLWQLLSYPISHKEFRQGMSSSRKRLPVFNYVDSVNVFLQSDTLQQFEAASRRMKQAGLENDKLKIWHAWNEMKVAIIYGDEDRSLYNSAVAELNKASDAFNKLIEYRNNNFTPSKIR